jgi:hypothetical protein
MGDIHKETKDTFKDDQNRRMDLEMNSRVLCMYQNAQNEFRALNA